MLDNDIAKSGEYAARSVQLLRRYPPSLDFVAALNLMGQRQNIQDEYPQAVATLSEAARVATALQGVARRPLPAIYAVLGDAQRHVLDFTGAEKSLRLALQVARSVKGEDSVDVIQTEYRLGVFLFQTGHPREGLTLLRQSVDLAVRTLAPGEVFHTPMVQRAYGVNLLLYGNPEESLPLLAQALENGRRAKIAGTTNFASTLQWTATSEIELGHFQQAADLLEQASAIYSSRGATPSSGQMNDLVLARARYLTAAGKPREALAVLHEFHDTPERSAPLATSWLDVSIARANAELALGQPQAAIDRAREVRQRIDASGAAPYFGRWEAPAALIEGESLLRLNRAADALPPLQRAAQLASELYDPQRSPALADSQIALSSCLLDLGRRDEARAWLARGQAIQATHKELGEQYRKPLRELEARLLQRQ